MNVKKIKEKLSNPWVAVNLLLLIVFLALVTIHIKISINTKPEPPLESDEPEPLTREKSVQTSDSSQQESRNVCETPECITLAHELHNYQDPTVDPCQDFYQHSCGKFIEHSTAKSRNHKKIDVVFKLIREFILQNKTSTSKSENAVKLVYGQCRELQKSSNLDILPRQALRDIFNDIKEIGAWPVLDKDWDDSNFDLNEMLRKLVKLGETNLGLFTFIFYTTPVIHIAPTVKQSGDPLVLKKTILKILEANGVQPDLDRLSADLLEYSNLEEKIKTKDLSAVGIELMLPDVNSVNFLSLISEMVDPSRAGNLIGKIRNKIETAKYPLFSRVNETTHLDTIIKSTPNRALANYLIFNFIQSSINLLTFGPDSKSVMCEKTVAKELPRPSLRIFMRNYVDKGNREEVMKLTALVKENVVEMVRETDTFPPSIKERLLKRTEAMGATIGYPDHFDPPGTLDKEYEHLNLDPSDSYYRTFKKLHQLRYEHQMKFIAGESPLSPNMDVLDVNAHYDGGANALFVNAPFLDDPLFDSTFPEYVNLFSLGFIIGHEIGHSIHPYDLGSDEWTISQDLTEYYKRRECLVDQYDNFDDPDHGRKMNGSRSIGENSADWVGKDVIWRAYKKMDVSRMPKLIGFENTSLDQLYFRIQALFFCGPRSTLTLEQALREIHGTYSFRVNGANSNMPEFAKAFNCPIGSPMNPEKKCKMF